MWYSHALYLNNRKLLNVSYMLLSVQVRGSLKFDLLGCEYFLYFFLVSVILLNPKAFQLRLLLSCFKISNVNRSSFSNVLILLEELLVCNILLENKGISNFTQTKNIQESASWILIAVAH